MMYDWFDEEFLYGALQERKIQVSYLDPEQGLIVSKRCAPLHLVPDLRRNGIKYRYQFWDFEAQGAYPILTLNAEQLRNLVVQEENFDPSALVVPVGTLIEDDDAPEQAIA